MQSWSSKEMSGRILGAVVLPKGGYKGPRRVAQRPCGRLVGLSAQPGCEPTHIAPTADLLAGYRPPLRSRHPCTLFTFAPSLTINPHLNPPPLTHDVSAGPADGLAPHLGRRAPRQRVPSLLRQGARLVVQVRCCSGCWGTTALPLSCSIEDWLRRAVGSGGGGRGTYLLLTQRLLAHVHRFAAVAACSRNTRPVCMTSPIAVCRAATHDDSVWLLRAAAPRAAAGGSSWRRAWRCCRPCRPGAQKVGGSSC